MKFLNNMTLGQYVPVESPVHHLDPRCKIVAVLLASWASSWSGVLWASRCGASFSDPGRHIEDPRPACPFHGEAGLDTGGLHRRDTPFLHGRTDLLLGHIEDNPGSVVMASRMGLRLMLLIMFAGMLTLTTSPTELADGLESLFSPFRRFGPAHELAMMMTIALRFIPTLLNETERIMKAQIARS